VFERVRALLQHPDYTARNPNRARSLVFAYAMMNPAAFHRQDAGGYVFWADRMAEFDTLNPQLAARLARVMDRWQQLQEPWRGAAREAIARVAARSDLSADAREILTRALQEN
jgi:aminopeptidase N